MEENKRSPVMIPVVMVHVGVLGFVSFLIVVFGQDLLISRIGMAGVIFSAFLMVTGLIAILFYRRRPGYFDDTTNALKAMSIFAVPIIAYTSLPFAVIFCFPIGLLAVPLIPLLSLFYISLYISDYAKGYCLFLKSDKAAPIKWLIFFYFLFLNAGMFFAIRELLINHIHDSFS